jgi:hypothetical protein
MDIEVHIVGYNASNLVTLNTNALLKINYDPSEGLTYTGHDVKAYADIWRIDVTVVSINAGGFSIPIPNDIILRAEIESEYYFDQQASNAYIPFNPSAHIDAVKKQITFKWPMVLGPEEYDLEWYWVSDQSIWQPTHPNQIRDADWSRVTVKGNTYTLSNWFDTGKLWYRVRWVHYHGADFKQRFTYEWYEHSSQVVNVSNDEPEKNWSYQAAFAEEGKVKEMLSFADGTGRTRQTVTRNNTDKAALIGETHYDYEGRPVITMLPTPTRKLNTALQYYSGFNTVVGGNSLYLKKNEYDLTGTGTCQVMATEFEDQAEGSSNYYSEWNPAANNGANAYIPDAQGYPYVRATFDYDGRPKQQSAPGMEHRLGGGHETSFAYATPSQEKLNRMFGNEVGYNNHYRINSVRDANGQIVLNYMDLRGNTIATSLVGVAPQSMDAIEGNDGSNNITISYDNLNTYSAVEEGYVMDTKIMVEAAGTFAFMYQMTPAEYEALCNVPSGDCEYDLVIKLYNDCNEPVYEDGAAGILHQVHTINPSTVGGTGFVLNFNVSFAAGQEGVYSLSKHLTLNQDRFNELAQEAWNILPEGCVSFEDLLNDELAAIDNSDCYTCQEYCDLYPEVCGPDECTSIPALPDVCTILLNHLKADMSPGGQYFDNTPFTLFSPPVPNNTWLTSYVAPVPPAGIPHGSWDDVRNNWDPAYADILVVFHPEYCRYQLKCNPVDLYAFQTAILSVTTYAQAVAAGFLPGVSYSTGMAPSCSDFTSATATLIAADPLTGVYGATYVPFINNLLTGSNCIWEQVIPLIDVTCTDPACIENQHWLLFRQHFLMSRNQFIEEYLVNNDCACLCEGPQTDGVSDPCSGLIDYPRGLKTIGFSIADPCIDQNIQNINDLSGAEAWWMDNTAGLPEELEGCGSAGETSYHFNGAPSLCYGTGMNWTIVAVNGTSQIVLTDAIAATTSDPVQMAVLIAAAVDNYPANENLMATDVTADMVQFYNLNGALEGWQLYLICDDGINPAVLTPIGSPVVGFEPCIESGLNCICNIITVQYQFYTQSEGLTQAEAFTAIATLISDNYDFNIPETDIATWLELCSQNIELSNVPDGLTDVMCTLPVEDYNCEDNTIAQSLAGFQAQQLYNAARHELFEQWKANYLSQCFSNQHGYFEHFEATVPDYEYHFTLYYYDQAGNLTRTVPPKGVHLLDTGLWDEVNAKRNDPDNQSLCFIRPEHHYVTRYEFNTLNQVTQQVMPDVDAQDAVTALSPPANPLTGLDTRDTWMLDYMRGYAATQNGVYYTTDGWLTAAGPLSGTSGINLNTIAFAGAGHGVAAGPAGTILETVDGGATWTSHSTGLSTIIWQDAVFVDATHAFIAGAGTTVSKIIRIEVGSTAPYDDFTPVAASNNTFSLMWKCLEDRLYFGASGSRIYVVEQPVVATAPYTYTASSPASGSGILTIPPAAPNARIVDLVKDGDRMACIRIQGGAMKAYYSTDHGGTWTNAGTIVGTTADLVQTFDNKLLANTGTGRVYFSEDFGQNWQLVNTGLPVGTNLFGWAAVGEEEFIAVGDDGLRTLISLNPWGQRFWYDDLGRIKASQDARQHGYTPQPAYSYTKFDALGRVTEAGEVPFNSEPTRLALNSPNWPQSWFGSTNTRQVTYTQYDEPIATGLPFADGTQHFLRNRIAATWYKENSTAPNPRFASHYSYDEHGNVEELVQENRLLPAITNQRYKHLRYEYDLISGNVNAVYYQQGQTDSYIHRYNYDADNRLTHAETSNKGHIWDMDAKYFYYLHGPLARTEIGHYKVQGMDYAYTIHGWLKGINAGTLDPQLDMGKDGLGIGAIPTNPYKPGQPLIHEAVGRDAFGMVIGYYQGDYTGIASHGTDFVANVGAVNGGNAGAELFNGNIRHIGMAMMNENQLGIENSVSLYRYDQLQRLKKAQVILVPAGMNYNSGQVPGVAYGSTYKYDPNGNILSLTRNGDNAHLNMDEFTYNYETNRNRLTHVDDVYGNVTGNDLPDQPGGNYRYDEMGNLIADVSEEIADIEWDVRGKVRKVTRTAGSTKSDLEFFYDALGQRVMKVEIKKNVAVGGVLDVTTVYARDATGNVMAVYSNERVRVAGNPSGPVHTVRNTYTLTEHHLYGASRLGMETYEDVVLSDITTINHPVFSAIIAWPVTPNNELVEQRTLKKKRYFLTDHQMSTRIQLSDRKLSVEGDPGQTGYYLPDAVFYGDYYSAGQLKNGRHGQETNIKTRYKHQGQEGDDEINGEGNSYAYEYRMSDPRTVRFWSLDPLSAKYAYNSPYAFSENRLIDGVELEGLEFLVYQYKESFWTGKPILKKFTKGDVDGQLRTLTIIEHNYTLPNVEGATAPFKTYIYTRSDNDVTETLIHTKFIYSAGVGKINIEDNDDNAGYIQNATDTERRREPVNAFFKDLSAEALNLSPIGAADDLNDVIQYENSTTEDYALAITNFFLSSGGGKGGKAQIRTYKPTSNKKHFVQHSGRKAAHESSGQPKRAKPELHEKQTGRGQRYHFHDIKNADVHHTWGKAKNKKTD